LIDSHKRLGRRTLQKCARLFVNCLSEEVVFGGVANVEPDCRIEFDKLNQIGLTKRTALNRRPLRESN
jgi:hypothetical protein